MQIRIDKDLRVLYWHDPEDLKKLLVDTVVSDMDSKIFDVILAESIPSKSLVPMFLSIN